jgi:hypothetical protein
MLFSVEKTATNPTTAAAMARTVSNAPRPWRTTGAGAGRGAAAAGRAAVTGAAAPVRGAATGAAAVGAGAGGGGPPLGPPGGNVGSLIVGAADGFGGRLMRTVSFFGWTFPVSFLGGTAPLGIVGIFSAINLFSTKTKTAIRQCQTRNQITEHRRRRANRHPAAAGILPAVEGGILPHRQVPLVCRQAFHPKTNGPAQ